MALPREYPNENCPIARSLEIIGERWTLLIVRDAFFGVRRFSDFRSHLNIPKAVLSERLALLVAQGVLAKNDGDYTLTTKGHRLWPVLWSMISWGDENYVEKPRRRTYVHADCDGVIDSDGRCDRCGQTPDVADLITHPPRRLRTSAGDDPVSRALRRPHRMLEAI
ncbi:winged helix-turn-helix transcriptional regulator [Mycobacterium sherrisii]|uniref:ArsR family transcriptional regulator n=1 Tax=Mycobacterium sherrisii TaxID=243061 RepID=A0A1E3SZK0_9MYCO|nr:helix-turn-helix domain-containing protein [Mycobacterium sherrisii]MCV7028167.1 helix-turn-helix transcriptional regulator [Mycobacterium sherrisii]MEC4762672.1 helix-turn-helix domain-containing protein [Mycobacterium sherrisii]ODR07500.1 ArsR family transcriptional regulator [Mycobacterium sherrisii]ORW78716.1 ArsR family transcriptional regulator [Mycobacterium sherrisii]